MIGSRFIPLFIAIMIFSHAHAQINSDSLIYSRRTAKIDGIVPTFYTPGYKLRAEKLKNTFEKAIHFYESSYPVHFKLKLAVLDSTQWVTEVYPYGLLNYDAGWAMIPADISYPFFLRLYGITDKKKELDSLLYRNHLTADALISSVFLVYSLHELGHYFVMDLEHTPLPDMFANEMIATYFSYNFFKSIESKDLLNLELFSEFISGNYQPKFRKIGAMDSLY